MMTLMILGLFILATATQASNNTPRVDFILEGKLNDGLSRLLDINQTFPIWNTTSLNFNDYYHFNNKTSPESDTRKLKNTSAEQTVGFRIYDKIVNFPINDTDIFYPKSYDHNVETDPVLFQNSSIGERSLANIYGSNDKVVPINSTAIFVVDDWHVEREELHQEILHQFDLISTDLQELAKIFSVNQNYNKSLEECSNQTLSPRVIRSLRLDQSKMCKVEHVVLVDFKDELLATLSGTNQTADSNCVINSNSDTCDELIRLILCGYNHLKSGFTRATENSTSLDKATMWKVKFEDYNAKSTRLLNDEIRFISQENQQKIDSFKTDLLNLQRKANRYLEIIKGDGPRVCAYEIQNGNIDKAINKFNELIGDEIQFDNYRLIDKIIEIAYNSLSNLKNVINFVRDLPQIEQQIIGFSQLFEMMKNNDYLDSYLLILFAYKVKFAMEQTSYSKIDQGYKNKFNDLKSSLPSSVRGLIWNGNNCTIRNRYRWEYLYSPNATFDSNRRYVFTWIEGKSVIEGDWEFKAYDSGRRFSIRNTYWNEYLYASAYRVNDYQKHRVFTWIPGGEDTQGYWQVSPIENGEYFTIRNRYWYEYLYSDGDKFNSERRYVYTWGSGAPQSNEVMKLERQWKINC